MRSYTNLAVVALAASSLCPVLSAPTQYTGSAVDVFRAGSENNSKRPRPESPPIGDQPPDEEPRRKKKQKTEGSFGGSESSDRNFVHGLPPAPEGSSGGSDSSNRNFVQGLPPAPPPSPESPNHPLPTYTNYIPRSASVSPILHSRIDSDSGSDPGPKSDPDSKPALEPETTPARRDLVDRGESSTLGNFARKDVSHRQEVIPEDATSTSILGKRRAVQGDNVMAYLFSRMLDELD